MSQRISVAMATYNGAEFIGEQLESLAAQTTKPNELIISDDGSTDATLEIIDEFALRAPFKVKVYSNPKQRGYSRNFEHAIGKCEGDLIFLCDQDDVWFPKKIEKVSECFSKEAAVLSVINNQIIVNADLCHFNVTMLDNAKRLGYDETHLTSGCATAIRRFWAELLFPISREGEPLLKSGHLTYDNWINEISVLLGVRRFIQEPLQYFRRHGNNTTEVPQSEPRPVSRIQLFRARQSRAPVDSWLKRALALEEMRKWLSRNMSEIAIYCRTPAEVFSALESERSAFLERAALVQLPFYERIPRIYRLWKSGGYKYFFGGTSAVRDLTRRG